MEHTPHVIDVQNLCMTYGHASVLSGVTFSVTRGEIVTLLGPNGAGKTTTLEVLEGLRAPSSGKVLVLGCDPLHADSNWRRRVGVVLQSWRDHAGWKVRDVIDYYAQFHTGKVDGQQGATWPTSDLIDAVGLSAKATSKVGTLSGGQRRRLDIALGILPRPELLFLDEPTAGLDPEARREFHDLIASLADNATTVVLTTHDLAEAEKLSDRILIISNGAIIADATADALRARHTGYTEVTFNCDGRTQVHSTKEPVDFLRPLLTDSTKTITDLEVKKATLEDAYIQLIESHKMQTPGNMK